MTQLAVDQTRQKTPARPKSTDLLQRKCACGQHTTNQYGECTECHKNFHTLQRSAIYRDEPGTIAPIVNQVVRSPGQPLDPDTRAFMEPRFGHDFSRVRVHTDAKAAKSARAVNALAYTVGRDIVFGKEQYAPWTSEGQKLIAHELTHTVQQSVNVQALQSSIHLSTAKNQYEHEAERIAGQVLNGNSSPPRLSLPTSAIQRTKICSKRLEAPGIGLLANHAYIDDTGRDDCQGAGIVGNYAVTDLLSGNFVRGCATKTDSSPDPRGRKPNMKPCEPKPGVSNLSQCLRDAFNGYAEPSIYSNEAVVAGAAAGGVIGGILSPIGTKIVGTLGGGYIGARLASKANGPNSNTFAATLARACCADASDSGLGWVPGWDHPPATTCSP